MKLNSSIDDASLNNDIEFSKKDTNALMIDELYLKDSTLEIKNPSSAKNLGEGKSIKFFAN